jgi:hypothetical protein
VHSNCLIFVIQRWWARGGYVIARKSRWGWWPHFLWSADLRTFEDFHPLMSEAERAGRWVPPCIFAGRIRILKPQGRRPD